MGSLDTDMIRWTGRLPQPVETAAGSNFSRGARCKAASRAMAEEYAGAAADVFAGAALATTRLGAQSSAPGRAEIEVMLAKESVRKPREAPSSR